MPSPENVFRCPVLLIARVDVIKCIFPEMFSGFNDNSKNNLTKTIPARNASPWWMTQMWNYSYKKFLLCADPEIEVWIPHALAILMMQSGYKVKWYSELPEKITLANIACFHCSLADRSCGLKWVIKKGPSGTSSFFAVQVLTQAEEISKARRFLFIWFWWCEVLSDVGYGICLVHWYMIPWLHVDGLAKSL